MIKACKGFSENPSFRNSRKKGNYFLSYFFLLISLLVFRLKMNSSTCKTHECRFNFYIKRFQTREFIVHKPRENNLRTSKPIFGCKNIAILLRKDLLFQRAFFRVTKFVPSCAAKNK